MSLLIHPSMVFVSRLPKALFSEPSKLLLSPNTMSDDSDDPSFTLELVCKRKSYKSGTTVTQCSVKKCTKSSCVSCYREMLSKHGLSPLRDRKGEIVMCCSKAHYKIASKNAKLQKGCGKTSTPTAAAFGNQPPTAAAFGNQRTGVDAPGSPPAKKKKTTQPKDLNKLPWNRDGAKGPSDPNNSEAILMKWLLEEGNYTRYCECKHGMTKKKFAEQIVEIIKDAGIWSNRDDKQVRNKIEYLQRQFRQTHDWATKSTGQGVKEGNPLNWENTIRGKFPFYFDLLNVMGTRASGSPIIDSEKGLDDDVEISSGDDDDDDLSQTRTMYLLSAILFVTTLKWTENQCVCTHRWNILFLRPLIATTYRPVV